MHERAHDTRRLTPSEYDDAPVVKKHFDNVLVLQRSVARPIAAARSTTRCRSSSINSRHVSRSVVFHLTRSAVQKN
jgi:hypothetical protein